MADDQSEAADINGLAEDIEKLLSLLEDIERVLESEETLSAEDIEVLRKLRELCQREREIFKKITDQRPNE